MKLTVLGSSGSMSGPASSASSYLVQAQGFDRETGKMRTWSVVLDMGPGSFGELWKQMDPRDVDALLISHGHADHMADIISFHVFLKWHPEGRQAPLHTAGPAEVRARMAQIDGYADEGEIVELLDFHPVASGDVLQVGPMRITAFPGNHTVESFGFRIEGPSEDLQSTQSVTLAYTGDTDSCDGMTEMAQGLDLLLAECGFTEVEQTRGIHLTGGRAGVLAREGSVGRLVLTHIQPWTDPEVPLSEAQAQFDGQTEVALAGSTWVL